MWTSLVVSVSLIVGLVLVVISIATGFTVLLVPIVVLELVLLAAAQLVRAELLSDEPARERRPPWRQMPQEAPLRAPERSGVAPEVDGAAAEKATPAGRPLNRSPL